MFDTKEGAANATLYEIGQTLEAACVEYGHASMRKPPDEQSLRRQMADMARAKRILRMAMSELNRRFGEKAPRQHTPKKGQDND